MRPGEPEVVTSEVAGTLSVPTPATMLATDKKLTWFLCLLLKSGDRACRDYLFLYSAPPYIPIKPYWSGSWCGEIAREKITQEKQHKQKSEHPIIWKGVFPNNNHDRNKWASGQKKVVFFVFLFFKVKQAVVVLHLCDMLVLNGAVWQMSCWTLCEREVKSGKSLRLPKVRVRGMLCLFLCITGTPYVTVLSHLL